MKCLKSKILLMVFLLAVLLSVPCGSLSGESTSQKLNRLSTELTEITKLFNEIMMKSELTLMDLQVIFPKLVEQLETLTTEVGLLENDSQWLMETSDTLLQKWTKLKSGIDKVSKSMEDLGESLESLEISVKKAEFRINIGLGISTTALIGVIALIIYSIKEKEEGR